MVYFKGRELLFSGYLVIWPNLQILNQIKGYNSDISEA